MKSLLGVSIRQINLFLLIVFSLVFWSSIGTVVGRYAGQSACNMFIIAAGLPLGYAVRIVEERYPHIGLRYLRPAQISEFVLYAPPKVIYYAIKNRFRLF